MQYPLTPTEKEKLNKTIKELEETKKELPIPSCFIQVHRSQIDVFLNILKMAQSGE